ncbi:hypothetical protein J7M28_01400 [bacterium]|nr:hypothetical protein [bacterium]
MRERLRPTSVALAFGLVMVLLTLGWASSNKTLVVPKLKVGQWALYTLTQDGGEGKKTTAELKYSIVGAEKFAGRDCLWHEYDIRRDEKNRMVYKLLLPDTPEVNAESMLCTLSVIPNIGVSERYLVWEPGANPTEADAGVMKMVNDDLRKRGKRPGFAQDEPIKSLAEMKLMKRLATIEIKGKKTRCQEFKADLKSKISAHRSWKYRAFVNDKVPIWGLARVIYEKTSFGRIQRKELTIKDFGFSGAESVVVGKPIKADMRRGFGSKEGKTPSTK